MLKDIIETRLRKLKALKEKNIYSYPADVRRSIDVGKAVQNFNRLAKQSKILFLAGRLRSFRDQGRIIFADLEDETGRIQLVLKKDATGDFDFWRTVLDAGDFVQSRGKLFKTQKKEKSLEVKTLKILVKTLRPLPAEWYGFKDVEDRFRRRYLDLLLNEKVKEKIVFRSRMIAELRKILWGEGFLEVETPILQPLPGGALAQPFKTHYLALKEDFYLRIAPELYLKRLLVAGFERIFEIGKSFRNEGLDREHNPEFTMLELYWAYADYRMLMEFLKQVLMKLTKALRLNKNPLAGRWEEMTFDALLRKFLGAKADNLSPAEAEEVFKKEIRPKLLKPILVVNLPKAISPLAKMRTEDPDLVERFQLIAGGLELVNGYSELNDPLEQRQRMEEQERQYRAGQKEASRLDKDFLEALEYGMPPAAGLGLGLDRLTAFLTGSDNIKEVIIFPALKSKDL